MDLLLNLPLDEVAKQLNRGGKKRSSKGEGKGGAKGAAVTVARGARRTRGGIRRKKGAAGTAAAHKKIPAFVDMTLDSYAKAKKNQVATSKKQAKQTKRVLKTTAKRGNQLPTHLPSQHLRVTKRVNLALTRQRFVQPKAPQMEAVKPFPRPRGQRGGQRKKMRLQQQAVQQAVQQSSIAIQKPSFGSARRPRRGRKGKLAAVPTPTIPVIKNFMKQQWRQPKAPVRQQQRIAQQFGKRQSLGDLQWAVPVPQFVQPMRQVQGQQKKKRQLTTRFSPLVQKLQKQPQLFSPPPRVQQQSRRQAQREAQRSQRQLQQQEQNESMSRFYSQHDTQRWQNDHAEAQAERPSFNRNRDMDIRQPRAQKDQRAAKQAQQAQSYPTVKVSNVPTEYSRTDILGAFKDHFQVHDVIMKNRGTAFVLFTSLADARMAKEQFDGGEMNDHKIKVSFADSITV